MRKSPTSPPDRPANLRHAQPRNSQSSGPVERIRSELRGRLGAHVVDGIPPGYHRMGRVVLLRLPEELRPHYAVIGFAYQRALGVQTVLRLRGPVQGEHRTPQVETLAGGPAETEVVEHGVRYRFDAAHLLFSRGNKTERSRIGKIVQESETVVDLFAGIGYFLLPALVVGHAARGVGVEVNPLSHRYLLENLERNRVAHRGEAVLGDNRRVNLPVGMSDRVLLGFLPDSSPWIPRALELLRPAGGWIHLHQVRDAREPLAEAVRESKLLIEKSGASCLETRAREVKAYGPGRRHVVVDAFSRPGVR